MMKYVLDGQRAAAYALGVAKRHGWSVVDIGWASVVLYRGGRCKVCVQWGLRSLRMTAYRAV